MPKRETSFDDSKVFVADRFEQVAPQQSSTGGQRSGGRIASVPEQREIAAVWMPEDEQEHAMNQAAWRAVSADLCFSHSDDVGRSPSLSPPPSDFLRWSSLSSEVCM